MIGLTVLSRVEEEVAETLLENCYEYLLAVSTDTLAVINSNIEIEKVIIQGKDNDAYLLSCDDINCFLDGLEAFEKLIKSGKNPLNYI